MKIRVEINKTKTRKIEKISKNKVWFFEKMTISDKI